MMGGGGSVVASQGCYQQQKKKNSSFQITSITSRLSNDGGEDSADDTEDISEIADNSRVTDFDQETPSYSEDYSKTEEVFFGPAPVIPTSSQYGITALVQQTGSGGVMTARLPQGVTVNVTEGGIALAKADGESDEVDHWQNRFKIVKIDSNEPFKRGRWICLDFMDSPAVSAASSQKKDENTTVIINSVGEKEDGADHQPQTVLQVPVPVTQQSQTTAQSQSHPVAAQYQVPQSTPAAVPMASTAQPTQGGIPMQQQPSPHMTAPTTAQGPGNMQYPSQGATIQGQLQPPMSQAYSNTSQTPQGSVHPSPSAQTPPQAQPPLQPPHQQPQQQPPLQQTTLQQPPSSQPAVQPTIQAATIPPGAVTQANVQQTLVPPNSHTQPPQQHQPVQAQSTMAQPSMNTPSIPQQGIPTQAVNIPQSVAQPGVMGHAGIPTQSLQPKVMSGIPPQGVTLGQQPGVPHQGVPPQSVMSQAPPQGVQQVPQQTLPQSVPPQNVAPNQQQLNPSLPSKPMPGTQPIQQVTTSQQIPSGQQLPVTQQHSATVGQATIINQTAMGTSQQVPVPAPATSMPSSATVPQASHGSLPSTGGAPTPATTPAQPQVHLSMGGAAAATDPQQASQPQQQPPTNLEGIPIGQPMEETNATPPAPGSQPEDTESASTASTVAIDNKIEQAMDLVKSHLMFAVREEVEVLKEKISELMERINQLEYENTVLRQYATQEALQQLQQPHHSSNT